MPCRHGNRCPRDHLTGEAVGVGFSVVCCGNLQAVTGRHAAGQQEVLIETRTGNGETLAGPLNDEAIISFVNQEGRNHHGALFWNSKGTTFDMRFGHEPVRLFVGYRYADFPGGPLCRIDGRFVIVLMPFPV